MTTPLPAPDPAADPVQQQVLAAEPGPSEHPGYGLHVGVTHLLPAARSVPLRHEVAEFVLVTAGALDAELDGRVHRVRSGDHFTIPAGCWHAFTNPLPEPASMVFAFGGDPGPVTARRDQPAEPDRGGARP